MHVKQAVSPGDVDGTRSHTGPESEKGGLNAEDAEDAEDAEGTEVAEEGYDADPKGSALQDAHRCV
jgi:hypothetical protein